jgi:hypothetical protein
MRYFLYYKELYISKMNNLTSFTAYFNSMKQTLQSHSMNYIELTNKIKELEGSFKAATPDFSNISSLINDTVSQAVEKYKPDLSSFITLINEAVEAAVAKAIASLNIKDDIKNMLNDTVSKIDFKSMIDKYIEEKLALVIATPIEEVNILELSQAADAEPAEFETEDVLGDASPDGSQQGSQEDDITIGVKKEKKTTKKRTSKK